MIQLQLPEKYLPVDGNPFARMIDEKALPLEKSGLTMDSFNRCADCGGLIVEPFMTVIGESQIPIVNNIDGKPYHADVETCAMVYVRKLHAGRFWSG